MFIVAHAFLGALIGSVFWYLTHDRRVLPLCIVSAILPDLLDKPLALLFPGILGSGRTLGHSLLFFGIVASLGLILWRYRHTLLGLACAFVVFSHQILDAMWTVPSTWFYPLMGPFTTVIIPDYIGHYFWLEISNLSEWVFGCALLLISMAWYLSIPEHHMTFLTERRIRLARLITAILLGGMGMYLFYFGMASLPSAFFAPTYNPITDVMAGSLALCGTIALLKWPRCFQRIVEKGQS